VIHGDAMGRKLGWPTINLELDNELLPAFGVYRSRVEVERRSDGERRRCELLCAVTNVGLRPTLHSDREPTLESHILDFEGDLYGSSVVIEMLDRLRGERRFNSVDELRRQIARDVAEARRRFSATAPT
ncbi:MAG: riboflavin kinase, partial [Acidobacteriota bacterium]|nr:riboflavin kinase [Acidobacteriota bacterium]